MAEARSGVAVARRRRCRCFRIPGAGRALPPLWPACRVPAFLNGKRNGDAAQSGIPGSICGETAGKARDAQGPGSCRVSSGSPASVAAVHGTAFIRPVGGGGCRSPVPGPQRQDGVRGARPCRPHPGWSQYPACWRFRPRPWLRSGRSGPGRCHRPECPPRFR